jgi:hypothetical protein
VANSLSPIALRRDLRPAVFPAPALGVFTSPATKLRGWPVSEAASRALLARSWQSGVATFSCMSVTFRCSNSDSNGVRNDVQMGQRSGYV